MFAVVITEKGGAQRREEFDQNEVTIGRVQGNDIILPKGNVSKRHSRIVLKDGRFIVVDLKSTNGTYVNGRKITSPLVVKPGDKIYIGDFILTVEQGDQAEAEEAAPAERAEPPPAPPAGSAAPPPIPSAEPPRFDLAEEPSPRRAPPADLHPKGQATQASPALSTEAGFTGQDEALRGVMARLATEFDVHAHYPGALQDQERWGQAQRAIQRIIEGLKSDRLLGEEVDVDALSALALREAVGLGALEPLLSDERVQEIVVNGPSYVAADFGDGLKPIPVSFSDVSILLTIARRLVSQGGKDLDPSRPVHHAALPYGPHVTVLLPPIAVRAPVFEIRRVHKGLGAEELVRRGMLDAAILELLRKAVEGRKSIAVVGPAGSGVTTLVTALAGLTDASERLVTAESIPDLGIDRPGTIALAAGRVASGFGLADVIRQASEIRSDRVFIDDIAGPELAEALLCLVTRRRGDVVGVHAGHDTDPLGPLRLLLSLAPPGANGAGDRLLAEAIDVLVQVDRLPEGQRVIGVHEIVREGERSKTVQLFSYDEGFEPTGHEPSFT